ncbi:hypothetical protein DFR44_1407, partial [Hydromonas duriensis]
MKHNFKINIFTSYAVFFNKNSSNSDILAKYFV